MSSTSNSQEEAGSSQESSEKMGEVETSDQDGNDPSFDLYDDMMGEEEEPQTPTQEQNDPSMDLYCSLLKEDGESKVERRRNVFKRVRQMHKDKARLKFAIQTLKKENKILKKNIETLYRASVKEVQKIKDEIAVHEKRRDERVTKYFNSGPDKNASNTDGKSQLER